MAAFQCVKSKVATPQGRPPDFGNWDAVENRLRRWEARNLWKRLWQYMQHNGYELAKQVCIDSTIMRAHQHAAGARKKLGWQNKLE
jgi:transposase